MPLSMPQPRNSKLTLLLTLYVSQAIPLGFFITAMPVILRQSGLSLENVGLFSAIAFPFLIKFLWAPAVDRWSPGKRRYLSWIVPLQATAVLCVAGIALLDLGSQMPWIVGLSALFMLLAATQDVASDGFAVTVLPQRDRGLGNGIQVGGYYLGQILGGGLMLVVFGRFGWTIAVLAMGAFLTLPLIPAARFEEQGAAADRTPVGMKALVRFFQRPGMGAWSAVVLLYRAGETMATYVFNQMLVDLGVSVGTIGWISGGVYAVGALAGALLSGAFIQRLGRKPALVGFALAQAAATTGYALAANGGNIPIFATAAFFMAFTGGMATTALYTVMMDASSQDAAASDFTLQQSMSAMGPLVGTAFSGFSAASLGFAGHYILCACLTLAAVVLVLRTKLPAEHEDP